MKKSALVKRLLIFVVLVPVILFGVLIGVLYWKQDSIVQQLIDTANRDFAGELEIQGSHIAPFANFPYVSIDLDHVRVYESKDKNGAVLLDVADVYLGFDLFTVLQGKMNIKVIRVSDGVIKLVQHEDGSLNLSNALSGKEEVADASPELHLDIKSIEVNDVHLIKINESSSLLVDTFIEKARSRFKADQHHVLVKLDARFEMNVLLEGDTTFAKHKNFNLSTQLDFDQQTKKLTIQPSELQLERTFFKVDGSVDFDDDMNMDIRFHGNKPNFNLFLAFAPEELVPALQRYDNAGKIFFEAAVTGKAINGYSPLVEAEFGCEDAFFNNRESNRKLDQLFFKGKFTTGEMRNASTTEFSLYDVSARPEAGTFSGKLNVKNFESPEIEMQVRSEFDLDFLAKFLNIKNLEELSGSIALTMNFHDIVDLDNPEKSIEKLNESYFTELDVKNLSFRLPDYHLPVHGVNIKASMDGHEARIDRFDLKIGKSDLSVSADISDLPAILHHTTNPVTAHLVIKSAWLDIKELTSGDTLKSKPVNEQISNLSMKLKFNSSARAFTESPNLPVGEFFIDDLYAKLNHYPHTLHDFHADVFVDEQDFRVVDFTGMIDKSDFHFNGRLKNYDLWFLTEPLGDTKVEFNLTSALLQLEDVFAYGGENYVPEDYRHEEFRNLKLHGFADLHFNKGLKSADVNLDKVEAQMKVHPMRFEKFKGRIHYEDQHLVVQNLGGKLGKSEFTADLNYYLGPDSVIRKRDNHFALRASHLDFDELFSYNPPPATQAAAPQDHESGFNIYDLPFTDMTFDFDVHHLNYHRYLVDNFKARAKTTKNHYIYIDTLSLAAAGGTIGVKGYFNGSDRNRIYFSPEMTVKQVDLDKLLFKFENFGQDHLVSENLHGKLSGKLSGKVHMHADMVPIIDDSELHLDIQVLDGRLERYSALDAMSDFFKDKNLSRVRFDTLQNKFDLVNGVLTVPAMNINSTLGFIEISGKQDLNMNMEYFVRVPLKLVTRVAAQKLFGKDNAPDSLQEDQIQYRDESKRVRFINLKISGTPDDYKIALGKDKNK
ncbi:MAG: membrane biogenesis protein [Cyclobacteriaceae bacterium]|nr:membrane biogenesis protein [Cyclobacteriaceae bacterium]